MKYIMNTSIFRDGKIVQEVDTEHEDILTKIIREVFDTKEKQLIEALIKLGWTPPKEGE